MVTWGGLTGDSLHGLGYSTNQKREVGRWLRPFDQSEERGWELGESDVGCMRQGQRHTA